MTRYKNTVKEMCETLATRIPINMPNLKKHLVVNADNSEFVLISIGHRPDSYHYNVVLHVEIKDAKILIHNETIDPGVFERLTDKGIPEADILPVYLENAD